MLAFIHVHPAFSLKETNTKIETIVDEISEMKRLLQEERQERQQHEQEVDGHLQLLRERMQSQMEQALTIQNGGGNSTFKALDGTDYWANFRF